MTKKVFTVPPDYDGDTIQTILQAWSELNIHLKLGTVFDLKMKPKLISFMKERGVERFIHGNTLYELVADDLELSECYYSDELPMTLPEGVDNG